MKRFKASILLIIAAAMMTSGLGCKLVMPSEQELLQSIKLTWWGVVDNPSDFQEIITEYRKSHPNISINYRKLRLEEYESELLNALAEDRGPDIISFHNSETGKWLTKLEPLPATTKMAYQRVQRSLGIKDEIIIEVKETNSITPGKVKETYVSAVYPDAVVDNKIYGLPLSVDTLALYYNRDLFNAAGLPLPPRTWTEVQAYVKKLTFQDSQGNLTQSGLALGSGTNVDRAADILGLLMMQNGAMMNQGKAVTFHLVPPGGSRDYNPGPDAVRFYTDFANPVKDVYTWNGTMPLSLDSFALGKTAMMIGYNYHKPLLDAKRLSQLNYGVAKMPQIDGRPEVNFANYWLYGVSKKSKYVNEAWHFIQFMTAANQAKLYIGKTGKPTAVRALVQSQIENDQLTVFAEQLLTAQNWYHGTDASVVDQAMEELIETVVSNGADAQKAAETAARKIQQTY